MTVIAYRDGVMAADSRETEGTFIVDDKSPKLYRLPGGGIFGGAGSSGGIEYLLQAVKKSLEETGKKKKRELPTLSVKGVSALAINTGGELWYYDRCWVKLKQKYHAIGSGSIPAFVAMDLGASAVEAVEAAKRRTTNCGGRTQTMRIK